MLVALLTYYLRVVRGLVWADWTGFGEYTGSLPEDQRAKTLWDWMDLLIVPALLGFIALWFNQAARAREQRITTDQQREKALQNYLDKMAELLLTSCLRGTSICEVSNKIDSSTGILYTGGPYNFTIRAPLSVTQGGINMNRRLTVFLVVLLFSLALVLGGFTLTSVALASQSTATVHGNGTINLCTGNTVPPHSCDFTQFIDQISINAQLEDSGDAHGVVIWTSVIHDVPADFDGPNPPGQGNSGYPWHIEVLELEVNGNNATIDGVVVSSPQVPEDVGTTVSFEIIDGNPDKLGVFGNTPTDIIGGNFIVWSDLTP